jgi:hypothetical protein
LDSPHFRNAFSPSAGPSPFGFPSEALLNVGRTPPSNPQYATFPFDATYQQTNPTTHIGFTTAAAAITAQTPSGQSQASGSHATTASDTGPPSEKDPFLSLLEQLAENEHSHGGPSELDFFLSANLGVPGESENDPETDAEANSVRERNMTESTVFSNHDP